MSGVGGGWEGRPKIDACHAETRSLTLAARLEAMLLPTMWRTRDVGSGLGTALRMVYIREADEGVAYGVLAYRLR